MHEEEKDPKLHHCPRLGRKGAWGLSLLAGKEEEGWSPLLLIGKEERGCVHH